MSSVLPYKLLVVDDEPDLRTLYELTLLREGYDVDTAASLQEAWSRLCDGAYSAVITDLRLPDGSGVELLHRMEQAGRPERAVVITAFGSPSNAVEALKAGAFDYLTKPVDLKQFRSVVASAAGRSSPQPAASVAGSPAPPARRTPVSRPAPAGAGSGTASALRRMAGRSPAIEQVRQLVEKVARSMAPVLVNGESGTGKELVARSIHDVSTRHAQPFVAVNCGAIPEHLLEAEFFGYRKGAFTGAQEDREGFFQAAQGGTLFLDEIGDLPLAMQSKLLRAVQERAVRPVGAVSEIPVDVRIVSATHKDLAHEVQLGRFRQDLYYRVNVIQIRVPALRERLADLSDICGELLQRISRETGIAPVPQLTDAALERLRRYAFPGNVRELENLLHRAVALSGREWIDQHDLGLPEPGGGDPVEEEPSLGAPPSAPGGAASHGLPLPKDLVAYLDAVERDILLRALERHRFNRTAAGSSLGLSLRQMRYRMARLGVLAAEQGSDTAAGEEALDEFARSVPRARTGGAGA